MRQLSNQTNACVLSAQFDFSTVHQPRAQTREWCQSQYNRRVSPLLLELSGQHLNNYAYTGRPDIDSFLLKHSFQMILGYGQLIVGVAVFFWDGAGGCGDWEWRDDSNSENSKLRGSWFLQSYCYFKVYFKTTFSFEGCT